MLLGADLYDFRGRLLLTKGTAITPKHIKIFKMWGVVEVDVEGISEEESETVCFRSYKPELLQAAQERVSRHYCLSDINHPALRELFRISTLQVLEGKFSNNGNSLVNYIPSDGASRNNIPKSATPADILKLVHEDTKLSTLPNIFSQINKVISNLNSSAQDISDVIEKDTNFSAKVLRIVNSAFYGYPSRIDKVSRAVTIIGTKQLGILAGGINILKIFRNIPSHIIDMKSFWEHSILCGINARIIGGYKNIQNTERLFVAGMLHDIGRLLLCNYMPELMRYLIEEAGRTRKSLYQVEKEVIGIDHASIAEALFRRWKLPMSLENIVRYHHQPLDSLNRVEASIVHVADVMSIAMGLGSSGEQYLPRLDTGAWDVLGISPNLLSVAADQAQKQFAEIFHYFFDYES